MFLVFLVLIEGCYDVILVNVQFGVSDVCKLVELICVSGKQLIMIYISYGDLDYYFGLVILQDVFLQVCIVVIVQIVVYIQQIQVGKLVYWGLKMGVDVFVCVVVLQVLDGDVLQLEGQCLLLIGLDGLILDCMVLWVLLLCVIVGGILVVVGEYVWMVDMQMLKLYIDWLQILQ